MITLLVFWREAWILLTCLTIQKRLRFSATYVHIAQLFGLPVETYCIMMPRTPLQQLRGKKHLQGSADFDLGHLGALLLSTAIQLSPTQALNGGSTAGSGHVLSGRSRSIGVIVFSRCHLTTLYKVAQPSPCQRNTNESPCQRAFYYIILEKWCYRWVYTAAYPYLLCMYSWYC